MADEADPSYEVGRLAVVIEQIRVGAQRAAALGMRQKYVAALRQAMAQLQQDSLGWGDPHHSTIHPGGVVCHRYAPPIAVQHVVYEVEKKVLIRSIRFLPSRTPPPPAP